MRLNHQNWRVLKLALGLAASLGGTPLTAQEPLLHNSIAFEYTTLRFYPHEQYIGGGLNYRFMLRPWIGIQSEVSKYPQLQGEEDLTDGGSILQIDGTLLAGHRWGSVGVYGEGGYGNLHCEIFRGAEIVDGEVQTFYGTRNYPDILLGSMIDVSVGHRWSLTFDIRDNMTFVSAYTGIAPFGPTYGSAGTINAPEGRAGVAFHF